MMGETGPPHEYKTIYRLEREMQEEERKARELLFSLKQKENKAKLPRDKRELYNDAQNGKIYEDGTDAEDELRKHVNTRINAAQPALYESSIPICKRCSRPNRYHPEPGSLIHRVHPHLIYLYCHCKCSLCRGEVTT